MSVRINSTLVYRILCFKQLSSHFPRPLVNRMNGLIALLFLTLTLIFFPLIHESSLTDALFLLVSKSDEVTTT